MEPNDNLNFSPKPIVTVPIRPSTEPNRILVSNALIQRMAAIRAYNSFSSGRDWIDKVSYAYVVALATRSADALVMQQIQNHLNDSMPIKCRYCREASVGQSIIRERLFPKLKMLRVHANKLIHHLADPANKGVSGLNIEGVFDYSYHLFQENMDALFGIVPSPHGKFSVAKCKKCK